MAGCDADGDDPQSRPRAAEAPHALPDLPPGWKPKRNAAAGFALGLPPGWSSGGGCAEGGRVGSASATLICSPGRLVSVSISADRTRDALAIPPERFAVRVLAALPGFQESLDPGRPAPFEHRYEAAQVAATGIREGPGLRQRVRAIALRRDRLVTLTAVIAANAEQPTGGYGAQAVEAVGTLRTYPPG